MSSHYLSTGQVLVGLPLQQKSDELRKEASGLVCDGVKIHLRYKSLAVLKYKDPYHQRRCQDGYVISTEKEYCQRLRRPARYAKGGVAGASFGTTAELEALSHHHQRQIHVYCGSEMSALCPESDEEVFGGEGPKRSPKPITILQTPGHFDALLHTETIKHERIGKM